MVVVARQFGNQGAQVLRQGVFVGGVVRQQHLAGTTDPRGLFGHGGAPVPGHENVEVRADRLGCGDDA